MVRRARFSAALVAALLALLLDAGTVWASSTTPAVELAQASAVEESEETAESAAEATEEAEEGAEEATISSLALAPIPGSDAAAHNRREYARKLRRLTREIHHVKHVKQRVRMKLVELKHLPATSRRRMRAVPFTRAKIARKRLRLHRLRAQRRALIEAK